MRAFPAIYHEDLVKESIPSSVRLRAAMLHTSAPPRPDHRQSKQIVSSIGIHHPYATVSFLVTSDQKPASRKQWQAEPCGKISFYGDHFNAAVISSTDITH